MYANTSNGHFGITVLIIFRLEFVGKYIMGLLAGMKNILIAHKWTPKTFSIS
jgi:hypothetical protein